MITINLSQSRLPYAKVDNLQIHSSYDPRKEAVRFIDSIFKSTPETIILLGPGLCYIYDEILKRFPVSKVICIFYSKFFFDRFKNNHIFSWHPESGIKIDAFLSDILNEFELEGLKIIEWPPSASAFPEISRSINKAINQKIRELNGNMITTSYFGRKWLKNSFLNFLYINNYITNIHTDYPIVIAASGPSLEKAISLIKSIRSRIRLFALSSSVTALIANNIYPDLIIQTDPGYFAAMHFRYLHYSIPTALTLPSATGIWKTASPVLLLTNSSFYENSLISVSGMPAVNVFSHGTVAGTALQIALQATESAVIFAGLDLCYNDILPHVRPHSFDPLFESRAAKYNPYLNQVFSSTLTAAPDKISNKQRTSLPLKTYAGWFSNKSSAFPDRVYRFLPSAACITGIPSISEEDIKAICIKHSPSALINYKPISAFPFQIRVAKLKDLLDNWTRHLNKAKEEFNKNNSLALLLNDPLIFNLFYCISLPGLTETKKYLRLQYKKEAIKSVENLLTDTGIFLKNLLIKINSI